MDGEIVYSPYVPFYVPPGSKNLSEGGSRNPKKAPTFVCGSCGEVKPGRWQGDPRCGVEGCLVAHGIPVAPEGWLFFLGKGCHGIACSMDCAEKGRATVVANPFADFVNVFEGDYEIHKINPDLYGQITLGDIE